MPAAPRVRRPRILSWPTPRGRIVQAFIQAWRAAGRYDPEQPLGPWLFAIVRHVAVAAWRRERRRDSRSSDDVAAHDLPWVASPAIDDAYDVWLVRRALDALPPGEREVVRLAHLEQLTHPEIAARMDVPVGTVTSRSHSAYRKLRAATTSCEPSRCRAAYRGRDV